MSTHVPNIGGLRPYEAESIDARLQKRRREQQDHQPDFKNSVEDLEEESGQILSVQALILFLEDFLEARLGSKLQPPKEEPQNSFQQWFQKKPSNVNEAAQAYAHGSKTARRVAKPQAINSKGETDLSHIYRLIVDLRDLKTSGIHVLKLVPDTDFIEGISLAVDRLKTS